MVYFFKKGSSIVYAVETTNRLTDSDIEKLTWLLDGAKLLKSKRLRGLFIGPRKEMITPWSTNAVEMAANMGVGGLTRMEQFNAVRANNTDHDPMLNRLYDGLAADVFKTDRQPEPVVFIEDIEAYDAAEGLALSKPEIDYLRSLSERLGRPLTDSEVFGFSQVNSEHCRHKIFTGTFIIDGKEMPDSLFAMIKKTSKENPNGLISAYKDNVAFIKGPKAKQFAPLDPAAPSEFREKDIKTVISLKAETHNFPTTVEPFNGAATGTGGEIRDRLGGGKASLPIAGTAVYMTSYPRLTPLRPFEQTAPEARPWLYQTPSQILIKASNGASDFGNKFGQPLITGSVLTFEHSEHDRLLAYDKVIMLAGGVGFGTLKDAIKGTPEPGMKVVVMGGDNYRIGMGGGAVSSVATGEYANAIELNAVQRANPEMQKRVSNVIRALAEMEENPCVSIHDHGAGGHLNALSELVEATGGHIDLDALPVGDPTLSSKEIVGNESQERMGLVMREKDIEQVRRIAERERAPFYVVGETTGDERFVFESKDGSRPIDLAMSDMFGSSPKTIRTDSTVERKYADAKYTSADIDRTLEAVLTLEAVACKDWLTNKVDRSVTGRIARQQCQGPLQLPLSDCGVVALDYKGKAGIATSIGHAPQAALIDPAAGSRLAIAEALTNIAGARLKDGLKSVSLSANWMWPCGNKGEDAALYAAVKGCSDFACALGINIPTGKDSLSMTQRYGDKSVAAPGTVIISAAGEVSDIRRTVSPVARLKTADFLYIPMNPGELRLGGSAFEQALGAVGSHAPELDNPEYFARAFEAVQQLVRRRLVLAMHDVSAGGTAVCLLEMQFANTRGSVSINLDPLGEKDPAKALFAENPAIIVQVSPTRMADVSEVLERAGVTFYHIGTGNPNPGQRTMTVRCGDFETVWDIDRMRDIWYSTSHTMERLQTEHKCADARFANYKRQPVVFRFPKGFSGKLRDKAMPVDGELRPVAAIIREKGINGDREMAWSLYMAGFDVKDVHVTDLTSGRETLDEVDMIVFCGGFSNSDVLGSAKGWAGALKYNDRARSAIERFYARPDTMSLGICNGCQLMVELGLIPTPGLTPPAMRHNVSGKFESAFVSVVIPDNPSIMLRPLIGSKLGIWVAHGEGRFYLPDGADKYNVAARYLYRSYPGNPNGSPAGVAAITSPDGRHLAMMPHLERALMPWQCGVYPDTKVNDEVTPWFDAFVAARLWIEEQKKAK